MKLDKIVYKQEWAKMDCAAGPIPDGFSLHKSHYALRKYNQNNTFLGPFASGDRPFGKPYRVMVSEGVYNKVRKDDLRYSQSEKRPKMERIG